MCAVVEQAGAGDAWTPAEDCAYVPRSPREDAMPDAYAITSLAALERLYDKPTERALLKQVDRLDQPCRDFIAASPFLILATSGGKGGDCSPRGDQPGLVRVEDDRSLLLPDRRRHDRMHRLANI